MKRDWDVIREVLMDVQDMKESERVQASYSLPYGSDEPTAVHVFMLADAGYISGIPADACDGRELLEPRLTWEGMDLLASLESKPVWERVKARATEEGVTITFDVVKLLAKQAIAQVFA